MTHGINSSYIAGCRCDPCREAHAEYMRDYRRRKGAIPFRPWRHGMSTTGYQRGCRCQACWDAYNEYQRDRRRGETKTRQLARQRAWKLRDEVLDWLELDGGWLTADGLSADLDRNHQSLERTLRILRDEGLVQSRLVELAHTSTGNGYHQRTEWRATS